MKAVVILLFAFFALSHTASVCPPNSAGRVVAVPLTDCIEGYELSGSTCYSKCKDGYTADGPICRRNCPASWKDEGSTCTKLTAYNRGKGYPLWSEADCIKNNAQGCEKYGAMWYAKCIDSNSTLR